jgi:hypothetical protein
MGQRNQGDLLMSANDIQHGGDHYKAKYQHWDWINDVQLDPYTYQATKYVSRWPKKDGAIGIKKAIHYVQKLIELIEAGKGDHWIRQISAVKCASITAKFNELGQYGELEQRIFWAAAMWHNVNDLQEMILHLTELLERAEASEQGRAAGSGAMVAAAAPKPPSDALGWPCPVCGGKGSGKQPLGSGWYRNSEFVDCEACDGEGYIKSLFLPDDQAIVIENCIRNGNEMKGKRVRVITIDTSGPKLHSHRLLVETMSDGAKSERFIIASTSLAPIYEPARDETGV